MKGSKICKTDKTAFDLSPLQLFLSIIAIFLSTNLPIARGAAEPGYPLRHSLLNEILSELRNDVSATGQPVNSTSLRSSKPTASYFPDSICTSPLKSPDPNDS